MTFTVLETALISIVSSVFVGIVIKIWADNSYVRKPECSEMRERCFCSDMAKKLRAMQFMMMRVCEELKIPVREQLEILEKEINS